MGVFAAASLAAPSISLGGIDKNDEIISAAIGVGGRGSGIGRQLRKRSRMIACCDVDSSHAQRFGKGGLEIFGDYRKLLDKKEIDAITIGTPDHWHSSICLRALAAGKDIYCEKPLTLTIDEGKLLCKAVTESKRVLQVGTQQRTEYDRRFLRAVAIVRGGKLGKIKRVTASIGGAPNSGAFEKAEPPPNLDWNMWLGQAPEVPYTKQRCHGNFRWWYEYSGGKMTDWGAHHVDIAQWAIGMEKSGPTSVEVLHAKHPDKADENGYNAAMEFRVKCLFPNGVEMIIRHDQRNGVSFEGENGELDVGRGYLSGAAIDQIKVDDKEKDWLDAEVRKLFGGREPRGHMDNFLEAMRDRELPMSDVFTHHRMLTTCHLANIALRTGKALAWDADKQLVTGDDDINQNWVKRAQRKGFEVKA